MGRLAAEIMAYRETLTHWDEGVKSYNAGNYDAALEQFRQISEPTSRIFFNMSCVHIRHNHLQEAIECLAEAVSHDLHFALGYFQRGVINMKLNRLDAAQVDFHLCEEKMRGCPVIDYKQLGLLHKLFHCEVLYNQALVHAKYGQYQQSEQLLLKAAQLTQERKHKSCIGRALQSVKSQQNRDTEPFQVPEHCIFHPPRSQIANLQKRDYIGSAQVVSSYEFHDTSTGFDGIKKVEDIKKSRSQPNSPNIDRRSSPGILSSVGGALTKAFKSMEDIHSSDSNSTEGNGKKRTPPAKLDGPKRQLALKQMPQTFVASGQKSANQKSCLGTSGQSEMTSAKIVPEKSIPLKGSRPRPPPPSYKPPPLPKIVVSDANKK